MKPGNFYKLAMEVQSMPSVIDSSDNLFTIQEELDTTGCSINSFNANPATVPYGGSSTISWNTKKCNSVLLTGPALSEHVQASGSWVEPIVTSNILYKLTASSNAGCYGTPYSIYNGQPCSYVYSNTTVTVGNNPSTCPTNGAPSVKVIIPNGGENYLPGPATVQWTTCKIPNNANMRIDLVMKRPNGSTITRTLVPTTLNDGTEQVTLPSKNSWSQMVYGNNFKIKVRRSNSNAIQDQSDNYFSINIPTVTVATDPTTPPVGTVEVDNYSDTDDVQLLKFTVKAEGSNLELRKIPVQITVSSNSNVSNIIDTMEILKDNNILDVVDGTAGTQISSCTAGSVPCISTYRFIFDDLSAPSNTVVNGTTSVFTVSVDLKELSGNYAEGDSVTASVPNTDVTSASNFSVIDMNGDQLLASQRFGSAQGNTQTLRTYGVIVRKVSSSEVAQNDGSGVTSVTYTMVLDVTAFGRDSYIGNSAQLAVNASGTNAIAYVFENSNSPSVPDVTSIAVSNFASNVGDYSIEEGQTNRFTLTSFLQTPSIPNNSYRLASKEIRVFANSALTTGALNISLLPPDSFRTNFVYINN